MLSLFRLESGSKSILLLCAILLAALLSLGTTPAHAQATPVPTGSYPRIGTIWNGEYFYVNDYYDVGKIQAFFGPSFTASARTAMKTKSPNAPALLDVNLIETTSSGPTVPSSYYLLDTNGNKICDWPGNPPNYILNMTDPTVATFVGKYAAQVLQNSSVKYDGIFFDNLMTLIANKTTDCEGNSIQISSKGDGEADDAATLNAAWITGVYTALQTFKSLAPTAYAVVHSNQLPPDSSALTLTNGDVFGFDIPNIREGTLAFGNLYDAYQTWFTSGQSPVVASIQSSPPNQIAYGYGYTPLTAALSQTVQFGRTFYPNMRFGLATTLMNNGFFIFDMGDTSSSTAWWYDEYNFSLGQPATPAQLVYPSTVVNEILNPGFTSGLNNWHFTVTSDGQVSASLALDSTTSVDDAYSAHIEVDTAATQPWHVNLEQDSLAITSGQEYQVQFWAKSDTTFPLQITLQGGSPNYTVYAPSTTLSVGSGWRHYTASFVANSTATDARLQFRAGGGQGNLWFDGMEFNAAPTRVYRRDFSTGVVLLNATNSTQTISLESGLARFGGSQAPLYQYIVDDSSSSFTSTGSWSVKTYDTGWRVASGPYYHAWQSTLHTHSGTGSAQWALGIPADGQYTLQVWLPAAPSASSFTSSAVYKVVQGSTTLATVSLDQSQAAQGDQWFNLGTFTLTASQKPVLTVTNGGTGTLVADAVYVYSSTARYNNGTKATSVTLAPMDGILLTRTTPNQTITFATPATQSVGALLTLTATASSGYAVSYYANTPTVCTVVGSVATMLSAGTCSISASQAGLSAITAAVPVTVSFTVK